MEVHTKVVIISYMNYMVLDFRLHGYLNFIWCYVYYYYYYFSLCICICMFLHGTSLFIEIGLIIVMLNWCFSILVVNLMLSYHGCLVKSFSNFCWNSLRLLYDYVRVWIIVSLWNLINSRTSAGAVMLLDMFCIL